jgi:tellurite resistance protein TehA-like permease
MGRTFVLGLCLAMLALLAYVTFGVAAQEGISVRVVISGLFLVFLGIAVIGAIGSRDE